jgi:hypothetical protein
MILKKELTSSAQDQADAAQESSSREDMLLAQLKDMTAQKTALEKRVQDRFHEIVLLTRIIKDHEATIAGDGRKLEWFRQVLAVFTKQSSKSRYAWIMKWLPANFGQKRIKASLKKQNLFDADTYTAIYPDVLAHNIDPFRHYILHGVKEGRIISRDPDRD